MLITRLLPNPPGKDRTPDNRVTNDQLNGEWVQFENTSGKQLSLEGLSITHDTFNHHCSRTGSEELTTFSGSLPAGNAVRLHTGAGQPWDDGLVRHLFLGRRNFVWNNDCGDRAVLRVPVGEVDHARYDQRPPEGVILERVSGTDKLAATAPVYSRRY